MQNSAFHHVNGLRFHVREAGSPDGPLVILLHGFPDFWWGWRRQIDFLAEKGFFVVAPDMRGYNLSQKPRGLTPYRLPTLARDVVALADVYGRERFGLAGHDWGGVVTWETAISFPHRVQKAAILNAPHPDIWGRVALKRPSQLLKSYYVGLFQVPKVPEMLIKRRNFALFQAMLKRTAHKKAFSPEDIEKYIGAWSQPGALTATINYYRALRLRRPHPPRRVTPPTLVIWGELDVFLDLEVARQSLKMCDAGESLFLKRATHWVQLEEVGKVNAALGRFFGA